MARKILPSRDQAVWALVRRQHGIVTRAQLLELGFTSPGIEHRIRVGRLHRVHLGVYAVGRPSLTQRGRWMAATLSCGAAALLSHDAGAGLLGIRSVRPGPIEVSVPSHQRRRRPGIVIHRRTGLRHADAMVRDGIPVTSPVCTLIDLAARLETAALEAAVNEADKLDLTTPERLRGALDQQRRRPGVARLKSLLDSRTFTLTDSELERSLLPLVSGAGLPRPSTQHSVNGFKVDFYWEALGLVVETDGLRYHRTPAQQARDRVRDQAHAAAGLTTLRFTHSQVAAEPEHVRATLAAVAVRLRPHGHDP